MYQLVEVHKDHLPKWLDEITVGGYNHYPPNFKPIPKDMLKFRLQKFFYTDVAIYQENRNVCIKNSKDVLDIKWLQIAIYWYEDQTGICFTSINGKVKMYSCAICDHDFKGIKLGNCWYKMTCSKCGYSYEVDSSG
jgi:hypothetical protein